VHYDVSDVVSVIVNGLDLLGGIVVVDAQFGIIGTDDNPLLAHDELSTAYRRVGDLDGPHLCLGLIVVNSDIANIESNENPRKGWMHIDRLDTFRAIKQLFLDFKLHSL
jgi:hypothetical protein